MSLIIKDDKLINEYKEICNKFSYNTEKEFRSKPIHNEKYIEIKLKFNSCTFNTEFHDCQLLENCPRCIYFTTTSVDFCI